MSSACPIVVALPNTIGCNFRRIAIFTQRCVVAVMENWSSPFRIHPSLAHPIRPPGAFPPLRRLPSHPSLRRYACKGKRYMPPFASRPGIRLISSQPLQLPLVLRPSSAREQSINTGPPMRAHVYNAYTFCFCLSISASLCRANDMSCIRANRDLASKKDLRFLSFRQ